MKSRKKRTRLLWTPAQVKTFTKDYREFAEGRMTLRTLRSLYGNRSRYALHIKASRLGLTKKVHPWYKDETVKMRRIPNFMIGIQKRLLARGLPQNEVTEVLFGPAIKVTLPVDTIRTLENLLNVNGKTDVHFEVNGDKVITKLI